MRNVETHKCHGDFHFLDKFLLRIFHFRITKFFAKLQVEHLEVFTVFKEETAKLFTLQNMLTPLVQI